MKLFVASALLAIGYSASQLTHSQVPEDSNRRSVRGDHDADNTITDAAPSSFAQNIKPHNADNIGAATPKHKPDVGILSQKQGTPDGRRLATECPPEQLVECVNGYNATDSSQSCEDACEGKCCNPGLTGTRPCDYFTGSVCKDDVSCFGNFSCYFATIDLVVEGCNGAEACYFTGYKSESNIPEINYGCRGEKACAEAAEYGGAIGSIKDSCNGDKACFYAAIYDGSIGDISSSCNGDYNACDRLAGYGGRIGVIQDSCIGYKACFYAAIEGGDISEILSSCNGDNSTCRLLAAYGGSIGTISKSCNESFACDYANSSPNTVPRWARIGQSITAMSDSCVGYRACDSVAFNGTMGLIESSCDGNFSCAYAALDGSVAGIQNSCNAFEACEGVGKGSIVTSILSDCCNMDKACTGSIPDECENENLPTKSPTKSPTNSPTKSPTKSPTDSPTKSPTDSPTNSPTSTSSPTAKPTFRATPAGTEAKGKAAKKAKKAKRGKVEGGDIKSSVERTREHHAATSILPPELRSESDNQRK